MTEVLFYHLQQQPLESVLPQLLERSLERGWRVVVQAGTRERVAALDDHLWTYSEDSFLPHGQETEPGAAGEPVVLAVGSDNPNGANVRFLVAGADLPPDLSPYLRLVLMFDGNDDDALRQAREAWKTVKAAGHDATYWQQNDSGRWEKKA
jgi:DNA polymerase III subunit chi